MSEAFDLDEETLTTEITIGPDGRIFVFGTSRPLLEILARLQPQDAHLKLLLAQVRRRQTQGVVGERN